MSKGIAIRDCEVFGLVNDRCIEGPLTFRPSSFKLGLKATLDARCGHFSNPPAYIWHAEQSFENGAQSNGMGLSPPAVPKRLRISSPAATVLGTLMPQQSPQ